MSPAVLAMAWASWGRMGALRSGFWLKKLGDEFGHGHADAADLFGQCFDL